MAVKDTFDWDNINTELQLKLQKYEAQQSNIL